jgi:hypothetical protein
LRTRSRLRLAHRTRSGDGRPDRPVLVRLWARHRAESSDDGSRRTVTATKPSSNSGRPLRIAFRRSPTGQPRKVSRSSSAVGGITGHAFSHKSAGHQSEPYLSALSGTFGLLRAIDAMARGPLTPPGVRVSGQSANQATAIGKWNSDCSVTILPCLATRSHCTAATSHVGASGGSP